MNQKSLALALLEYREGMVDDLKLDPNSISSKVKEDIALAKIIADETEAERNKRRGSKRDFEMQRSLLGETCRYVDTLHWDHFIDEEAVYLRCAIKAKLPAYEIIKFVCEKCAPNNARAMMWLWFYLYERHEFQKYHDVTLNLTATLLMKQKDKHFAEAKAQRVSVASKAAKAAHAPRNEAKAWVQGQWEERGKPKGHRASFARTAVKLVLDKFGLEVTEKTIYEVWLKTTPPA
jgi:hypothetical protein